jgi:CDP-diacylglycerol--glycerol-3-phosphate 3-phosphatidyltransferase
MPTIYQLKPAFQNLLRPLTKKLITLGISANQITLTGTILSFFLGAFAWYFPQNKITLLMLALFQLIRMGLNAIDGMMAREHNQKTTLGAILNELSDVFSDIFLYYPFTKILMKGQEFIAPLLFLAVIAEMTGVVGVQIGASRRYDGPFGKSDRAFIFGTLALLIYFDVPVESFISPLLVAMITLSLITIFNRAKAALKEVSK